jgi:hypothetical protein
MTAPAIYVHNYLSGSYIGAFFRSILQSVLGINPGKPVIQAGAGSVHFDDQLSESVLLHNESAGRALFQMPSPQAGRCNGGRSQISFLPTRLPFSHSIRYYPRR